MSETDDTDVLLLIPPGFFLVNSSGSEDSILDSSRTVVHKPSCTARVLGKLVDQVHSLESRLESLELSTTSDTVSTFSSRRNRNFWESDSLGSRSLDRKSFTFPRRRRRKNIKRVNQYDLSLTSLDSLSTLGNDIPPLKLADQEIKPAETLTIDTPNMEGDLSSITSTPTKKNDKLLLHEIDEFLTKVESYESPDSMYKSGPELTADSVIKATGDYISSNLDSKNEDNIVLPSGKTISNAILDKYIYLVKNNGNTSQTGEKCSQRQSNNESQENQQDRTLKPNDITEKTHDTKSPSIRKLNFSENKDIVQLSSTPKRLNASGNHINSFRPTSNKIYDRASKVLEQYKAQSYHNSKSSAMDSLSPKREEFKIPQMRPYVPDNKDMYKFAALQNKFMDTIDTDLLSLSELWGEKGDRTDKTDNGKLEEERLKREHCETIIQQLQRKLLEQQEKLAVAVKVDRAKDAAIAKLKDAWLKLTGNLDKAEERHRSALEKMVTELENFKSVADDAQKKTNHFETELYKALDLAHDYQEKCKKLASEKKELQENMQKNITCHEEIVKSKEKEIEMLKENCETIMRLNKQSTDCVKNLEDALEKEKKDHEQTKSKISEMNQNLKTSKQESVLIREERDLLKEKVNEERARCNIIERQLCEKQNQTIDLLKKCDTLDSEVKSLRKHIEVQKNELKSHYQKQLEEAVMGKLHEFQQQLDQAERDMEADARARENNVVDTYNKQITRIEEQHKLEINVLEEKQKEEIKLYRLQLAQAGERITLLESKLESFRRRRGQIASQLHGVMEAQWRQALLILTHNNHAQPSHSSLDVTQDTRHDSMTTPAPQDYAPPKIPPLTMPTFAERGLLREGRRPTDFNLEGLSDNELQHYVKLLLTKPPSLDGSGDCAPLGSSSEYFKHKEDEHKDDEPTSDRPDKLDRRDKVKRSLNSNKPPWKS